MFKYLAKLFRGNDNMLESAIRDNDISAVHKVLKSGLGDSTFDGCRYLKEAIDCENLEIVCMILYYYPSYQTSWKCCTPLRYAIMKRCSADIQRVLLDYEDLSITHHKPTLFLAVHFKSPVIVDMIERGVVVEPYYEYGLYNNIVIHAMESNLPMETVKILWDRFDFVAWRKYNNYSILSSFTKNYRYLPILMENERKLQSVMEHYDQTGTQSFVCELYISKMKRLIYDENEVEGEVFHYLSYGASIFTKDLDSMYCHTSDPSREFFKLLLYMDLKPAEIHKISPMYFKYTPVPDLNKFLDKACLGLIDGFHLQDIIEVLQHVGKLYSFLTCNSRIPRGLPIFTISTGPGYTYFYRKSFMLPNHFPSLKQLARDASRVAITKRYNVRNSCQFYTIIDQLPLPNEIRDILILDLELYYQLTGCSFMYDSNEAIHEVIEYTDD